MHTKQWEVNLIQDVSNGSTGCQKKHAQRSTSEETRLIFWHEKLDFFIVNHKMINICVSLFSGKENSIQSEIEAFPQHPIEKTSFNDQPNLKQTSISQTIVTSKNHKRDLSSYSATL